MRDPVFFWVTISPRASQRIFAQGSNYLEVGHETKGND